MAHISGHVQISAPATRVFETVADSRNEPSYNPAMHDVELLTPPPVGPGSRFLARMGRNDLEMRVELTEFDRPRRLGSRTTSSMMTTSGALTFEERDGGTQMRWDWEVQPHGWFRVLGPLGGRMEQRIWAGAKRHLRTHADRASRRGCSRVSCVVVVTPGS